MSTTIASDFLAVTVYGEPVTQGSKRAFRNQYTGNIKLVESPRLTPWRTDVRNAIEDAMADRPPLGEPGDPFSVHLVFGFRRPRSHYRTGRNSNVLRDDAPQYPTGKKNDLDKLERAILDAITSTGLVWHDDGQVIRTVAAKLYVDPDGGPLDRPGVRIMIRRGRTR